MLLTSTLECGSGIGDVHWDEAGRALKYMLEKAAIALEGTVGSYKNIRGDSGESLERKKNWRQNFYHLQKSYIIKG